MLESAGGACRGRCSHCYSVNSFYGGRWEGNELVKTIGIKTQHKLITQQEARKMDNHVKYEIATKIVDPIGRNANIVSESFDFGSQQWTLHVYSTRRSKGNSTG